MVERIENGQSGEGWFDGAPPSVASDALHADLIVYRRMTCPRCLKRGMKVVPQHSSDGRYRLVLSCRTCRHVEAC